MFRSLSKLAGAGMLAVAGTLAPYSVDVGAVGGSDELVPLVRLNTACAQSADIVEDVTDFALGCVLSVTYICETRRADYIGYRNR